MNTRHPQTPSSPKTASEAKGSVEEITRSPITVFFDGDCPLCRREIAHYRRLRASHPIIWLDIAKDTAALEKHGLSREAAMARFHVLDAAGQWHTGVSAFLELWTHFSAYRLLAKMIRVLRLETFLDRLYARFATWRLRRRCDSETCGTS